MPQDPLSFPLEAREPELPSVPPPPNPPPKITKAVEKPVPKIDSEYVHSEMAKLNFFIDNNMLQEAKHTYNTLKSTPKELKKGLKYDFKLSRLAIELLELN